MKEFISSNIYEFPEEIALCGTCLPSMDKQAFLKLQEKSENIYSVCLESIHMNMVAHKLASVLRLGKTKRIIFASVDKSPHCIQLHYLKNELEKIMDLKQVELKNYVCHNGELVEISQSIISLSKNLNELSKSTSF